MRTTTLTLDDDLLRAVEGRARRSGQTMDQVIERVLREVFLEQKPAKPYRLRWVTVEGKLQPEVDLDDRDSLLELMDGRS
jgi:hypothetical protein